MDSVVDSIVVINQADIPPDDNVTISVAGGGQSAHQVRGRGMGHSPHILIHHVALLKSRLGLSRKSVVVSETGGFPVLVVIIMRDLTIMIIESGLVLVALIVPSRRGAARQGQWSRCTSAQKGLWLR